MTDPDGTPHRRRRRPPRQPDPAAASTAPPPAATGSPGRGGGAELPPDQGDAVATVEADQQATANDRTRGKRGRATGADTDPARGRRDGEAGRAHGRDPERGWRELAGSSPSQVGLSGAMRARDVARPTLEDLAAAERSVTVVRRHWQPPEG